MIPKIPFTFAANETLSPRKVLSNFQQTAKDVTDMQDQKYTYSSFVLNYDGITSAMSGSGEDDYFITPPRTFEIIGIEIEYYDDAASTITFSSSITGFIPITLTSTGTLATRAYTYKAVNITHEAGNGESYILNVSAGTVNTCKVTVHIRTNRFGYTALPADYKLEDLPLLTDSTLASAATLNTEFSEVEAAVTADAANQEDLKIQVISRRNVISPVPTSDADFRIPSSNRTIHSWALTIVNAVATNNILARIRDEVPATVSSLTSVANGATDIQTSGTISETQGLNAPQTTASDYKVDFARSGAGVATIPLVYVVLFYV